MKVYDLSTSCHQLKSLIDDQAQCTMKKGRFCEVSPTAEWVGPPRVVFQSEMYASTLVSLDKDEGVKAEWGWPLAHKIIQPVKYDGGDRLGVG
jgi:hypothetical protein